MKSMIAVLIAAWSVASAVAQTAPSAFTTGYRYDLGGQLTGVIGPDPDGAGPLRYTAVRYTYVNGMLRFEEEGELAAWQSEAVAPADWGSFTIFQTTEHSYDSMGRESWQRTAASGSVYSLREFKYDSVGRLQCEAIRMSPASGPSLDACSPGAEGSDGPDRITYSSYSARDLVTTIHKAYGTPLQQASATYTYTGSGKVESVTDANGNRSFMTYDGHDRLQRWYFPSATTPGQHNALDFIEYGYDGNGNRRTLRWRDGRTVTYEYDALNRVRFKDVASGTAADVWYRYDLRGLLTDARFVSDAGLGIHQVYDGFGRRTSSSINLNGTTRTVGSEYDDNGNRRRLVYPDGALFDYAFDGMDRLSGITDSGGSQLISLIYNARGERRELIRGAGIAQTTYGYDAMGRLQSLMHDLDGAGTANDVTYGFPTYNAASQVTTRTITNELYEFVTALNASRGYTPNGLNQYSQIGSLATQWDANGNLSNDGATTFGYDVDSRLISATGAKNASVVYDPLGRLYQLTNTATSTFIYDGDDLVIEYDGSGGISNRHLHGSGVDEPLVWFQGPSVSSGNRRYVFADYQGSTVAVVGSSGSTLSTYRYDPFGVPNSTNGGYRFQYTGQVNFLGSLGLNYYKARFYNPSIGRFMQLDPIGYRDGYNLYSYVDNDPVNFVDPSGTSGAALLSPEILIMARPMPTVSPALENAVRIAPDPIPPTTLAQGIGRALAQAAQRPRAPRPDDLKQGPNESIQAFARRISGAPEKTRPQVGYEPVRRGAPEQPWWASSVDHAIEVLKYFGIIGSVTVTPLPPDWVEGDPIPESPQPPTEPSTPHILCAVEMVPGCIG